MADNDSGSSGTARKRVSFDPTINLGHVLTMLMFIGAGVSMYFTLDKRISKQEDLAPVLQTVRDEKDSRTQASLTALSSDLKEVKQAVDKLSLSVQVQSAVNNATKGSK